MSKELRPFNVESEDIITDNIEKLKELFPEILTENKIDFEKLRLILGDDVEESPERYNFTWNGKKQAMKLAQQPTTATLKPNKDKSKNWDNTQNIYIEGDNLEVLKLLQKSYSNRIKMIYIDPPYNTGQDFVYKDNFSNSINNYLKETCQIDGDGNKKSVNTDTNGRYHTDWLNMMYPRLKLGRNLLTEDGVMFISIDDNESANLKKILDEIFGEKNLITQIAHKSRASVSNDKIISQNHNIILLYAKNYDVIFNKRSSIGLDPVLEGFSNPDSDPNGDWKGTPVDGPGGAKKGNPYYEFLGVEGYFRYSKDTMQKLYNEGRILKTGSSLQRKYYLEDAKKSRKTDTSWWEDGGYTTNATRKLIQLMDGKKSFDTPKPVELITRMIALFSQKDDIILDFFSGSGTTAEAVMKKNSEDGLNRKFILIQLPESVNEKSDAYKEGWRIITDIAEERIRRAGEKIVSENPEQEEQLDNGFKVFELSNSNIKKWDFDVTNLEAQIEIQLENIENNTNDFNLVYEIMLKQGLDLSLPIEERFVGEAKVYKIAYGALFVVLGSNIKSEVATKIVSIIKDQKLEDVSVVIKDTGFINDSEKLNAIEILNTGNVQYDDILSI